MSLVSRGIVKERKIVGSGPMKGDEAGAKEETIGSWTARIESAGEGARLGGLFVCARWGGRAG